MAKIVLEHYPVARLPEDLRLAFPQGEADVRVTIESMTDGASLHERGGEAVCRDPKPLTFYRRHAAVRLSSVDEVNAHVRGLRGEWDDRSR